MLHVISALCAAHDLLMIAPRPLACRLRVGDSPRRSEILKKARIAPLNAIIIMFSASFYITFLRFCVNVCLFCLYSNSAFKSTIFQLKYDREKRRDKDR